MIFLLGILIGISGKWLIEELSWFGQLFTFILRMTFNRKETTMKKLILVLVLISAISGMAYAGVKDKALEIPNATASLVNKVAVGTNDNATSLVGGANRTAHNLASDVNEFGKSIYRFFGGSVE
jgi:hypothetical protein